MPRSHSYTDARGISACSRWLSEATPPEYRHHTTTRTPAGVPAPHAHAIHAHLAPLPHCLCHEEPGTRHRHGMALASARVFGWSRPWCGWHPTGRRWCRGSRSSSRRTQTHALSLRLHAGVEEGIIDLDLRDDPAARLPLARGLRGLHRQRLGAARCAALHRPAGGASSPADVSGGIRSSAPEIRNRIRRTVSRLIVRRANIAGTPAGVRGLVDGSSFPVVRWCRFAQPPATGWHPCRGANVVRASVPVVSLRSTTGYRLASLRDGRCWQTDGHQQKGKHLVFDAGGIPACSRWSRPRSGRRPPVHASHQPLSERIPAGMPAPLFAFHHSPGASVP